MSIIGLGEVFTISHKNTTVVVDSHGAKVLSIKNGEKELLFYDKEDIGHSGIPLCFPNFGPLKNGEFIYNEKSYPMNQHGFVRDSDFSVEKLSDDTLICKLYASEETKKHYPFDFEFFVTYKATEKGLDMLFTFRNLGDKKLPLSPGVHPYFAVTDKNGITITTMATEGFDNSKNYQKVPLDDLDIFEEVNKNKNGIRELLIKGVPDIHLIGHNLEQTIVKTGGEESVVIEYSQEVFSAMTIWRKTADVNYICVEPSNVQNGLNSVSLDIGKDEFLETVVSIYRNI